MKNLAMRDFQQKGPASVGKKIVEPILLTGRKGPLFFLVPVDEGNLDNQYKELLRAMAQASLRNWQDTAHEEGLSEMNEDKIDEEIAEYRSSKKRKNR
jgi:hypothetical protein